MESYLSRWARVLLSMRSFVATTSMSAPDATMARKKLRPMRPKPLIPTRTVTAVHLFGETVCRTKCQTLGRPVATSITPHPSASSRTPKRQSQGLVSTRSARDDRRGAPVRAPADAVSGLEHVGREVRVGAGDPELLGPLVGHGEQATDATGHGVLRHGRLGQLAELLEAGLLVLEAQHPCLAQVVGDVLAEQLHRAL